MGPAGAGVTDPGWTVVGGEPLGLPGERALLPALVDGAAAAETALIKSLTATGRVKRVRAASFRRLRRPGTLLRTALRDR